VNKPLRGGKGSTWEGGLRVCTLAWWPGSIPKGSTSDEVMTVMDLLPTFASLSGGKVPGDRIIDGKDISPLLMGKEGAKSPHEAFYYFSQNHLKAVRCGDWKLHKQGKKTLLHNLREDIGESKNVAKENPEVVARLEKMMTDFNAEMKDPTKVRKAAWVEKAEFLVEVK
ncbi:MAG: sulfatase-like hydrolase/transferase, partial [Kiritimatiellae bacterium]|nr:sulfatase-like hydrolase/transferase [Kiritimatiellia bacterium]